VDTTTLSGTGQFLHFTALELTWNSANSLLRKSRKHCALGEAVAMVANCWCQHSFEIIDKQLTSTAHINFLIKSMTLGFALHAGSACLHCLHTRQCSPNQVRGMKQAAPVVLTREFLFLSMHPLNAAKPSQSRNLEMARPVSLLSFSGSRTRRAKKHRIGQECG
jgi:hypothetical protein